MNAPIKKLLITFLALFALTGCDESTQLHTGLSEREANEVLAELMASGIDTSKQMSKNGVNILVAKQDIARAVRILRAVGLPRRDKVSMGEVFKKEGIISTPIEERARYIHAISQEIEHTLSQIDGVVLARVHVVLPQKVSPGQPLQPSSAAVFIKHQYNLDPDILAPKILRIISASVPGLKSEPNAIALEFFASERLAPGYASASF